MKSKQFLSALLCVVLIIILMPVTAMAADQPLADGGSLDLSTLSEGDTVTVDAGASVTIWGSRNNIQISCGAGANVTFNGVTIDDSSNDKTCPISFTGSGSTLTLTSSTTNTLKGGLEKPAVCVEDSAELTIDGTGSLNATSGSCGAAIGASFNNDCGTINIKNGIITATAYTLFPYVFGAGIGGGANGSGGDITISGGIVIAESDNGACDIGCGEFETGSGTLKVDGGANLYLKRNGTSASVILGDVYIKDDSASSPIADGYYVDGVLFTGTVIDMTDGSITGSGASYVSPTVTITESSNDYLIMGETTSNAVIVSTGTSVTTDVILFDADIQPASGCAFDMSGSKVSLELCGASTLTSANNAGLMAPAGATLTISSTGSVTGSLTARGGVSGAGIGAGWSIWDGGDITINNGTIVAAGGGNAAGIGGGAESGSNGSIAIKGGNVTAIGGANHGAGIGGAFEGSGGTIRIEGGTVNATGSVFGAGIGGGDGGSAGNITITGGSVTAAGNVGGGAGIGGGHSGNGGAINITDGTVNATGGDGGAGIGGGDGNSGGNITIFENANVTAQGGNNAAGIGGGLNGDGGNITISGNAEVTVRGGASGAGIGGGVSSHCGTVKIQGGDIVARGGTNAPGIGNGYLNGATATGGTVVISGGMVDATGGQSAAGIGGGYRDDGCNITISGGTVNAKGGTYVKDAGSGAGIGGGRDGDGGTIRITGGIVNTTGGASSAGIGGGVHGSGGSITITGGTVTAQSIYFLGGAGIGGGGDGGNGGTINISGDAIVTAVGKDGAGIGGGSGGNGGIITISGGTVTATGSETPSGIIGGMTSAGIGGGGHGGGGEIIISGSANVTAQGSTCGAGIGGGSSGTGGIITISGGVVNASGSQSSDGTGAGIGGGEGSSGGTVTITGGVVLAKGSPNGQDIGTGSGGSDGTLSISGTAAVFLANDSYITPVETTTHTHFKDNKSYGITMPGNWTTFGAYLRIYTLSFVLNSGDGTVPVSVTKLYNETSILPDGNGISRTGYTFAGWNTAANGSGTSYAAGSVFTFSTSVELYAQWRPTITGLPEKYTMYKGGRVTWDPQPTNGTWSWDENFFSATFNSPATFTALKPGISTVTYTVDDVTQSVAVTIKESELPQTGQNDTLLWIMIVLALLCGGMAVAHSIILKKRCAR